MIIDLVRKPIQMVGFGIVGAGTGIITGVLFGGSVILVNDAAGFIVSGGTNDQSKPLKADAASQVMLFSTFGSLIIGAVTGVTVGAIV